ncbi:molybdopterin molybdotransferase MoeA [Streptomyces sp. NPDC047071]|uniref:molybdopterin molybdotransferase MoeA n=1 Tax=Streptomyces sp. NPDC047071 TaxID=3154808 RepID=UPI0034570BF3
MTGGQSADAELDEALALVNEDRAASRAASVPPDPAAPSAPPTAASASVPPAPGAPSAPPTRGSADVPPAPGSPSAPPASRAPSAPPAAETPGTSPVPRAANDPAAAAPGTASTPGPEPRTAPASAPPTGQGTSPHRDEPGAPRSHPEPSAPSTPAQGGPGPQRDRAAAPGDDPAAHGGARHRSRAASWPEARAVSRRAGGPGAAAAVATPLSDTLGRVLTSPLAALTDLPSFDTSAMDGWAVAGPGPWTVLADGVLAGQERPEPLGDGEAVRIATGARIPQDATAVIRSEHARVDDKNKLHAERDVVPGQDIRPRAQECRAGDQLLPPGALVTPAVLGLAAAAGYDALSVAPRPRAEVLVLGDELLTEGLPHEGRIRDALGPMLPPWLRALGVAVTAVRRLGDDAEALYEALARSTADVIVTTGGTASGPVDHVHPALRRLGAELLVDGVAVRPGHPMLLARLPEAARPEATLPEDSRPKESHPEESQPKAPPATPGRAPAAPGRPPVRHLVGLPGNPLAAVSGLLTLAEPLLRGLAGRPAAEPYTAPLRDDVHGHPHDTRLVPVVLRAEYAVPLHYNGPAMLRGIAVADGLAVVPPGGARRRQEVEILDLPWTEPGGSHGELGPDGSTDPFSEVCFT